MDDLENWKKQNLWKYKSKDIGLRFWSFVQIICVCSIIFFAPIASRYSNVTVIHIIWGIIVFANAGSAIMILRTVWRSRP